MKEKPASEGLQLLFIFGVCVLGEILHALIPVTISSGVYGMVILFILLCTRVIKLSQVEKVGDFMTGNMLVMFIPASVALIDMFAELQAMAIPVIIAITLVTVMVMVVTGKIVQLIMKITKKGGQQDD